MLKQVLLRPEVEIYIPNAFTPNLRGPDENNDFNVVAFNVQEYEIDIFNRWGQRVFYSNDISKAWDGNSLGKPAPNGAYSYTIRLVNKQGKEFKYRGTVTLIR